MYTKFKTQIRKALYGILLVGMVMSSCLTNTSASAARVQADATGSGLIFFDNLAKISPSGNYIAQLSAENYGMKNSTIWITNMTDGTNARALVTGTDRFWVTNPIWSPDSLHIVYMKVDMSNVVDKMVVPAFELWIIDSNGSNNRLLTNTTLFKPVLGYGGKTDITWNTNNEIEFYDHSAYPVKKYAINVTTLTIRDTRSRLSMGATLNSVSINVPMYYQTDYPNNYLDNDPGYPNYCNTIAVDGCAVTSIAMVLAAYNIRIGGNTIYPNNLNDWLTNNGGFSGCQIGSWTSVEALAPDQSNLFNASQSAIETALKNALSNGNLAILWYYTTYPNMHFVVATGYAGEIIHINDPVDGPGDKTFGNRTWGGLIIYSYSGSNPPLPTGFNKSSPTNSATGLGTTVTLEWGTSSGADSYEHCYDATNNDACDNTYGGWIYDDDTNRTLLGLTPGTTYYWQVKARNSNGETQADGGTWWSFTTQSATLQIDNNIDTVYYDNNYAGYTVIKGDHYWYRSSPTTPWYTDTLSSAYSSSPDTYPPVPTNNVDAAYYNSSGVYTVIKGDRYWYRSSSTTPWYTDTLSSAYSSSPNTTPPVPTNNVDTVYYDNNYAGYTVIKGDRYWYRSTPTSPWYTDTVYNAFYSSPNAALVGVPTSGLDAAYFDVGGGYTVIKGDRYWYRSNPTALWYTDTLFSAYY